MRRSSVFKVLFLSVVITVAIVRLSFSKTEVDEKKIIEEEYAKNTELFTQSLFLIHNNYVNKEKVEVRALIYGAIEGMLKKLDDPHSRFMDPEIYREMQVEAQGSFGGLGIVIGVKDDNLTVISPIDDTPAYKAGIKAGDWIREIEKESTENITLQEAVKKLRGSKGTKVNITIKREGEDEPLHFTITRDVIKIESVRFKLLKDIGYLRISVFNQNTNKELKKVLSKLKKKKIKGLILDLRNNPGGLLNEAVEVTDKFISEGLIVSTKGRVGEEMREYRTSPKAPLLLYPLIVLINEGSASGAEIVAGAIQDNNRGVLLGSQSFGKGSVQSVVDLPQGCGLSLTTAKYYTPSGRSIQGVGITPDIIVKYPLLSEEEQKILRVLEKKEYFKKFAKKCIKSARELALEFKMDEEGFVKFAKMLQQEKIDLKLLRKDKELWEEKVKLEIIREIKGEEEAYLFALKQDPCVKRALEILKASEILEVKK